MDSVANSVLKRIRAHGRGWVFTPRDFLALGTRRAAGWRRLKLCDLGELSGHQRCIPGVNRWAR
jgi:hypothetical protein